MKTVNMYNGKNNHDSMRNAKAAQLRQREKDLAISKPRGCAAFIVSCY